MNNAWKSLFPTIGNLGLPLFARGKVTLLSKNDGTVHAHVDGFQVEILLDEDCTPVQMRCSCPRTHELCPHMAAVLYALEEPKDSWSAELEQLLDKYYDAPWADPVDDYELMADMEDAMAHLLIAGEQTPWVPVEKIYRFAVEQWRDPKIDPDYHGLVLFGENTLGSIFEKLTPVQREQMRLHLWEVYDRWYSHTVCYLKNLIFSLPWDNAQQQKNQSTLAEKQSSEYAI